MPIPGGTAGAHDDAMHQGSAKRGVIGGVAGLDGTGDVLCIGNAIRMVRDGVEGIYIIESTSGEYPITAIRNGVDDFFGYIKSSGVNSKVQLANMKDIINGIAALGAGGQLLAPGSDIELTRDGSERVELMERTSSEIIARWTRAGVNDYTAYINCSGAVCTMQHSGMKDAVNGIAGLDGSVKLLNAEMPGILNRYTISDDVLHPHDTEVLVNQAAYTKYKTITLTALYPDPSTIRVKFDMMADAGSGTAYGRIYKNGGAVGTERTTTSSSYVTFTEDISFAQGDTLELWSHIGIPNTAHIENFRVYGDDGIVPLSAAIVSTDIGILNPFIGANS